MVKVSEIPSLNISEEEYSLRIETRHEEKQLLHRKYAIEHHSKQEDHSYPHLQFKFHTEEIGTFRLRLDFNDSEEYKRAILGFIYKIKNVLSRLEKYNPGIINEILVLDLVDKLSTEGQFLSEKISESITKYQIEFQKYGLTRDKVSRLKNNSLLIEFLGMNNVEEVAKSYNKIGLTELKSKY